MMPICYKNRRKKKMAIVYRPQRSEIKEAMSELKAFDTSEELLAQVKQDWKPQYPDAKFRLAVHQICLHD